jgi:phage replication initiation protein
MGSRPITAKLDGGMFGFTERHRIAIYVGGVMAEIGSLCMGGEAQRGRWMFQLSGKGCAMVSDWEGLRDLLEGFEAKITRVDLAVDFLQGEHTVDDAVSMLQEDQFTGKGRRPSSSVAGDWLEGTSGRTLYVGKAKNGKMLRVYEKGKQMGDLSSAWVRFEVQFGNRDRVIPFDCLTAGDAFFAGAYPALAVMVEAAALAIDTTQTDSSINLALLMFHMRRCYGKALHQAESMTGVSHSDLIEEVRIVGIPRRINPAGLVAGITWSDLQDQLRKIAS